MSRAKARKYYVKMVGETLSGLALAIRNHPHRTYYSLDQEIRMSWSILMNNYSVIDREILRSFAIYVTVCLLLRTQREMKNEKQGWISFFLRKNKSPSSILSARDVSSSDLPNIKNISRISRLSPKELFE